MKSLILGACSIAVFSLCSQIAYADPVLYPRIQGSGFFVGVDNRESVGYNCNVSYTINYVDFGNPGSQDFQTTTSVSPNGRGDVVTHQTAWAASTLGYSNFSYSCFRANQSSQSQVQSLPGGTYNQSCRSCVMNGSILSCRCDSNDTSIDVNRCGSAGRNLICNNHGNLSCPGPC